jgi:hypothetical protein
MKSITKNASLSIETSAHTERIINRKYIVTSFVPTPAHLRIAQQKARDAASHPPSATSASFSNRESESLVLSPNSNVETLPFYDFLGLP